MAHAPKYKSVNSIEDVQVPDESYVVFDWDNTLKKIHKTSSGNELKSGVPPSYLDDLIKAKRCKLFIISAIRPSKINMNTLLLEVDKLGLRRYFNPVYQEENIKVNNQSSSEEYKDADSPKSKCLDSVKVEEVRGDQTYFHWGNIIICGYDKAEVFLEFLKSEQGSSQDESKQSSSRDKVGDVQPQVVFFDDEEVNIINFSQIVKNSTCFLVQ